MWGMHSGGDVGDAPSLNKICPKNAADIIFFKGLIYAFLGSNVFVFR